MPAPVPPSTDERTLLLGFLVQLRYAVKLAAYGLTDGLHIHLGVHVEIGQTGTS
jgi:hypothetical protein